MRYVAINLMSLKGEKIKATVLSRSQDYRLEQIQAQACSQLPHLFYKYGHPSIARASHPNHNVMTSCNRTNPDQ